MGQPICGHCDAPIAFFRDTAGELKQFPHECNPAAVARVAAAQAAMRRKPHNHHCAIGESHDGSCYCRCGAWRELGGWMFAGTAPRYEDEMSVPLSPPRPTHER